MESLEDRRLLAAIEVTTVVDSVDANDGEVSLREAIDMANASAEQDTITFASFLDGRTIELSKTSGLDILDNNVNGDLDVKGGDTIIEGNGQAETVISALGDSSIINERVMHVLGGARVTLRDLTIRGGRAADGGGVLVDDIGSSVTLENVLLTDNVTSNNGGAVLVASGASATVIHSTIEGNSAIGAGGGILSLGTISVDGSTIRDNAAENLGGGIYVGNSTGSAVIDDSTVSGNSAGNGGGGLTNLNATTDISNSTFSGNTTDGLAGAILNVSSGASSVGSTTILNSTITLNQSGGTANVHTLSQSNATSAPLEFGNTIFVSNIAAGAPNLTFGNATGGSGSVLNSLGNNLLDDDGFGSLIASDIGNVNTMVNPVIDGVLADNGGPTLTHALIDDPANLAIDGGSNSLATGLMFDQREAPFPRVVGTTVDVGAVELIRFDADDFIVNSIDDDGFDFSDSDVTLREAIFAANFTPGSQEITFDPSVSNIVLSMGQLSIGDSLIISGPGRDNLTIDGDGNSRVFDVGPGDIDVTLQGLTITGGHTGGSFEDGGAIRFASTGTLTISDSTITGNTATDEGGAIRAFGSSTVALLDSTLSGNSAGEGGGIRVNGTDATLTVTRSTISGNTAGIGGGMSVADGASADITDSTFSGNASVSGFRGGGAIFSFNATLNIVNTTISGNQADDRGGGLRIEGGNTTVTSSTIALNRADADGNDFNPSGGGISVSGNTLLVNTIVAGNVIGSAGNETADDLGGSDVDAASHHNLIGGPATSAGLTDGTAGNIVGQDDGSGGRELLDLSTALGPLADNGGPTLTHALLPGSPAIEAGDPAFDASGIPFDQRGNAFFRVSDGDLDATAVVDIGAFELQRVNQQPTFTATSPDPVLEDADPVTVPGFATFDPGDPSESGQSVIAYTVSNLSDPTLFSTPPAIDTDGNLTFTPAENAFGISTFEVTVRDSGGTTNGGVDTSEAQTFQIAVTGVNDPPTFTLPDSATVNEDAGPRTILDFASGFDPGPGEDGASTDSQVIHDEGPDGTVDPLSRDNANPTDVGKLAHGSNIVRGYIDAAQNVGDVDVFTFQIDPGFQLDGLFVLAYDYITPPPSNERAAFLAINDAATFPYNAQELDINQNPNLDESLFLGGTVFGLDDLPGVGGGDILPRAGVITGRGFTPPLGAGTYTIYIQQTGPANTYELDFRVTETSKQSIVGYTISNIDDPSLFASGPQIDSNGTLTFRPAADAHGTAMFDVTVQDDGGTDNNGVDTSMSMRGTIIINSVNDQPTFTASDPPAILENSSSQLLTRFVTSFDPGPDNESDQTVVAYTVSNLSDASLFATPPAIDTNGNLTYTPAADVFGSSTFDVTVQDSGGTARGGVDTSEAQTFTITIKEELVVTFNNPADIFVGTPLGDDQLNAVANLPGTFVYTPGAGTVLDVGDGQTLAVGFTADDPFYDPVTVLASINVLPLPVDRDFGDAPSSYPVLEADDGARHTVDSLLLGTAIDAEADGQPSAAADGDGADDDGVVLLADMVAVSGSSTTASFRVTASQAGLLDAWIDFGGDGSWDEPGDQIATSIALTAGANTLPVTIPGNAVPGQTAARFRLSTAGNLGPRGEASDGEVEDYIVTILDGSTTPGATVELVSGATTIIRETDNIVVRFNPDLFSVPANSLGLLEVQGIVDDETISVDFSGGNVIPAGGLSIDGGGGSNTLALVGDDGSLDLTGGDVTAANFATIDLGADHVNVVTVDLAAVQSLAPATGSIMIIGSEIAPNMTDDVVLADADDWRMGATSVVDGRFIRSVVRSAEAGGNETLQTDLPHAWQNVVKAGDVNNNGDVTAGDALVIINELARRAFSDAETQFLDNPLAVPEWPDTYYDQNGDDKATALDALRVINELARISVGGGEFETISAGPAAVDLAVRDTLGSADATVTDTIAEPSRLPTRVVSLGDRPVTARSDSDSPINSAIESSHPSDEERVDEVMKELGTVY